MTRFWRRQIKAQLVDPFLHVETALLQEKCHQVILPRLAEHHPVDCERSL